MGERQSSRVEGQGVVEKIKTDAGARTSALPDSWVAMPAAARRH
ncbi:hypothetical protein [Blastococcus sp. PRF04-17]|nr:hypothetical protein [Blastococcus sp. PRF04-17]